MLKLSEYLAVAVAATIKFVGGPIAGVAFNLKWWETTLFSAIGMMITVILVIYGGGFLGNLIQKFRSEKPRKIFSKTTRIGVKVKSKLGLWGIALLTPFIFTPIVGSFLANEIIKFLSGSINFLNDEMLTINSTTNQFYKIKL